MLAVEAREPDFKSEARAANVIVTDNGDAPYAQLVRVRQHALIADESEANGGRDAGPSPQEFLLVALGTCAAITLRMYARRHDWRLRRATVELWHEVRPDADGKSMVDHFHRTIHLDGDLSEEQRQRLLEIAKRCPVSRTLGRPSVVISDLADADPAIAASATHIETHA